MPGSQFPHTPSSADVEHCVVCFLPAMQPVHGAQETLKAKFCAWYCPVVQLSQLVDIEVYENPAAQDLQAALDIESWSWYFPVRHASHVVKPDFIC